MSAPLDLAQLERFLAISEHGSFRAAADALRLTQPTLSWSIRQLETTVGASLFERGARGAKLTPAGEILLPRARLIVSEGERARHDLDVFKQRSEAFIAIGVAPLFINTIFPVAAAATLAQLPDLTLRVIEGYSGELVAGLQSGKVDIAFGGKPPNVGTEGVIFEPTYQGQYLVIARRGHPILKKKLTDELVLDHDFVMVDAVSAGFATGDFPARNLKAPHVTVRTSSMQCVEAMVLNSDLLGYVARDYVRAALDAGTLREVPTKALNATARAGILSREGGAQTPAMRILKAELRKACKA
jgi:DNA-binding transcriptional LysR family regulator